MKAAQLVGPKRFELVDAEVPAIQEGQCLIKLERASICGSDIHREYGQLFPEEHYPVRLGRPSHECAGVVVESRCEEYREGQRVIVLPTTETSGGLVEYIASKPSRMAAVPDDGDLGDWLMCQPSGTVLYSCERMGNLLGKDVVIVGQGAIGLSFTMITAKMGPRHIIGVDLLDYRLEWSKAVGATHTVNPLQENLFEVIDHLTQGRGPDVVVEAAGFPDALNMCFRLVRQFGTLIIFGIQMDQMVPIEHSLLLDKQATILPTASARGPDPIGAIQKMVDLRERGWLEPARLVTHRLPFEEVQKAYDMYEQQQDDIIKVVMSL